jgi:hypothetical protein
MNVSSFDPARTKYEAVVRISALTNSKPVPLARGSTERKQVLIDLANGLGLNVDINKKKTVLAEQIVKALGGQWTSKCYSKGETITLVGLNAILRSAASVSDVQIRPPFRSETAEGEARAISQIIHSLVPQFWDAKECVKEMKTANFKHWKQVEWQGWYLEFIALPALISALGGAPVKIGTTTFDYQRNFIWDLKTHSNFTKTKSTNSECPLNDQDSMKLAIQNGGLGLVVLSGDPVYGGMDFAIWHKRLRGSAGDPRRELKSKFKPTRLDLFFIENTEALRLAEKTHTITSFNQGRQSTSGNARKPKYSLNLQKGRDSGIYLFGLQLP